ncbi:hypothetical protein SAMN06264849_106120 [Melghirimyces algeriensis]|uniref:Uncharacterized protein n=1 Tax=Melghirimyces algeriensis TaxID=910412 RepID=A0A521DL36_9BACL|nr:hypothetical protein SAMN06264849_106120 [Melghirimyces algeriensis]
MSKNRAILWMIMSISTTEYVKLETTFECEECRKPTTLKTTLGDCMAYTNITVNNDGRLVSGSCFYVPLMERGFFNGI